MDFLWMKGSAQGGAQVAMGVGSDLEQTYGGLRLCNVYMTFGLGLLGVAAKPLVPVGHSLSRFLL